jgi:hypothetical protein
MTTTSETEFEACGKRYTLVFDINTFAEIEIATGKSVFGIGETLVDTKGIKVSDVRAIFHAGLRQHQSDLSLFDAGGIMAEIGLPKTLNLIAAAVTSAAAMVAA